LALSRGICRNRKDFGFIGNQLCDQKAVIVRE
jgi:hypothetical protein